MEPTIEEQAAMFDRWNCQFRQTDANGVEPEIAARARRSLEFLDSLRLDCPRILEIGCGTGWLTAELCQRGTVWACDLSSAAITYARSRGVVAEFVAGNVLEMDLPSADVAVVFDTLFYVEDQARLIEMLAAKVDWLVISNINTFVFQRCAEVTAPKPGQYRKWLTLKEMKRLLAPQFRTVKLSTVYPYRGNLGIMRVVQSSKLNRLLFWLPLEAIKNSFKLGAGVVTLAKREGKSQL